jgi:hypothetical protein
MSKELENMSEEAVVAKFILSSYLLGMYGETINSSEEPLFRSKIKLSISRIPYLFRIISTSLTQIILPFETTHTFKVT